MRFKEFNLFEATARDYYTVGDSHAVGLANYAGKPWKNLGKNGTSSDDAMHLDAIRNIPKGSVVVISVGANDTFQGKVNPQSIANNVKSLVDEAKIKGLKVTYLLFPVGTRPNAQLREKTRDAIKRALDVNIVDLEGSKLVDGVHADSTGYVRASAKVLATQKPDISKGIGNQDSQPGAPPTKDKIEKTVELRQGPPFPNNHKNAVKKIQKSLEDLGYSIGSRGQDGRYGPNTAAAVAAFKKDYNLSSPSSKFGDDAYSVLEKIESGEIPKVQNPTKVNRKSGLSGRGGQKEINTAFKEPFFMERLKEVASNLGVNEKDLLGVMRLESELNPKALNPTTNAVGLIQFIPDTARELGYDTEEIYDMSATEQLDLVEKYYKNKVKPGDDIADIYMATFMPAAKYKPDSFVLGNIKGGRVFKLSMAAIYRQNKMFDTDNDGIFTVGDVRNKIRQYS